MTETPVTDEADHIHHTIDYVELGVTDMAAAQAFYAAAFGWSFTSYGPSYAGIRWITGDAGEVGGLNAERAPGRGGPLVLIWSADVDASAGAVRAAGGEVVEGPYEFSGGHRFHFLDPAGNELGVWGA